MQNSLLVLLVLSVFGLIALGYAMFRSKQQGKPIGLGLMFLAGLFALFVPILGYSLYLQSTAKDRLHVIGIDTPSTVGDVVGVANGAGGKPLWMFQYSGTAKDLMDFYASSEHRNGWQLTAVDDNKLKLRRPPVEMLIKTSPGSVTYLLTEAK